MGDKSQRKIQLGAESTAGTAVAASTIWRGPAGDIVDESELILAPEDVGNVLGYDRSYIPRLAASYPFPATEATFEQLPYVLSASILDANGSADGGGSGFVYSYPLPTTAEPSIQTYTLEAVNALDSKEMSFAFVESFNLAGRAGEAWMLTPLWRGRSMSRTTATAALARPAVEEILFGNASLTIDAADGTIGTTAKSGLLLSASLEYSSGFSPRMTAGRRDYYDLRFTRPTALLTLTFEYLGDATAEEDYRNAQTPRLIRLESTGSSLTTAGTHATKKLRLDLHGLWMRFEPLGELNGNDVVSATFAVRDSDTESVTNQIVIVNELSALP